MNENDILNLAIDLSKHFTNGVHKLINLDDLELCKMKEPVGLIYYIDRK